MLKTILLIVSVLCIVSFSMYLISKRFPHKDFSELAARVKLWWGMVAVFSAATFLNPYVSIISLAFLCFFALKEFFSMKNLRKNDRKIVIWAYLAIPIQFYLIISGWYGMFIIFIPIFFFFFLPLARINAGGTKGFLKSVSTTQWGLMLMVYGLSHLAYFQKLSPEHGAKYVLFLVLLTQLNDVVQYLVSRTFGKKRVIEVANPHVTTEGFLFAVVVTVGSAVLIGPTLTPMNVIYSFFAGLLISVTGFIGNLNISFVKRDLLLEGKGKYIPRNESILSRIDSLSYTAPLFFHFIRYFFH